MSELASTKILVVDDEKIMRDLVQRILNKAGYEVETLEDGEAALQRVAEGNVDMVISDVNMPGMSGFDLLKQIKQDHPQTAVIMMTGYADTFTIKDALMFGADEYITKPFKHYEVTVVVERALWRLQSARQQSQTP
jgi:two-component system response regulator AtoC